MARKKINSENKKGKLSVTISNENYEILVKEGMNKSKLINWLLVEYFNTVNNGK